MSESYLDRSVKHDIVFLFDVTDGNPNGDPDAGNRPRTDDETSQGLITDVALKRKVRDIIGLAATTSGLDPARYQVFVEAGHALNTRLEESYAAIGLSLESDKKRRAQSIRSTRSTTPSLELPRRPWQATGGRGGQVGDLPANRVAVVPDLADRRPGRVGRRRSGRADAQAIRRAAGEGGGRVARGPEGERLPDRDVDAGPGGRGDRERDWVRHGTTQTWTILRTRLGWSKQRPARRAVERNDEAIATWVKEQWPRIKKAPGAAAPGSSSKTNRDSRSSRR
jgi:hypothetical protein